MAKYILLYRGPEWDMSKMTKEAMQASRVQWETWMKGIGPAMVGMGAPMKDRVSIVDGNHHLNGEDGKYTVEDFKLTEM